jgi:hypothetical protein
MRAFIFKRLAPEVHYCQCDECKPYGEYLAQQKLSKEIISSKPETVRNADIILYSDFEGSDWITKRFEALRLSWRRQDLLSSHDDLEP